MEFQRLTFSLVLFLAAAIPIFGQPFVPFCPEESQAVINCEGNSTACDLNPETSSCEWLANNTAPDLEDNCQASFDYACDATEICCNGQCLDEYENYYRCLVAYYANSSFCEEGFVPEDAQCSPSSEEAEEDSCDLGVFDFFGLGIICFFIETFSSIIGCLF